MDCDLMISIICSDLLGLAEGGDFCVGSRFDMLSMLENLGSTWIIPPPGLGDLFESPG